MLLCWKQLITISFLLVVQADIFDDIKNAMISTLKRTTSTTKRPRTVQYVASESPICNNQLFFHPGRRNYATLYNNLNIGWRIKLEFDIIPVSRNGILMSIKAENGTDFLILMLRNKTLSFIINNGAGDVALRQPVTHMYDGQWHRIQAFKEKNIIGLSIDGSSHVLNSGFLGFGLTDTNDSLYVGGAPLGPQFVGCIRNIVISDVPTSICDAVLTGRVSYDGCPLDLKTLISK